jgi:hypothetical protein
MSRTFEETNGIQWDVSTPVNIATIDGDKISRSLWNTTVDIKAGDKIALMHTPTDVFVTVDLDPIKNTVKQVLRTLEKGLHKRMPKEYLVKKRNENMHNKIMTYGIGFRHETDRENYYLKYSEGRLTPADLLSDRVHFGGFERRIIGDTSFIFIRLSDGKE